MLNSSHDLVFVFWYLNKRCLAVFSTHNWAFKFLYLKTNKPTETYQTNQETNQNKQPKGVLHFDFFFFFNAAFEPGRYLKTKSSWPISDYVGWSVQNGLWDTEVTIPFGWTSNKVIWWLFHKRKHFLLYYIFFAQGHAQFKERVNKVSQGYWSK